MADKTEELFESLGRRGRDPLLLRAKGTVLFELHNGQVDMWSLKLDGGTVAVSHAADEADCTIRAEREVFDRIATGELNPLAAVLRGEIEVEGDPELLLLFQRLLPGPRNGNGKQAA